MANIQVVEDLIDVRFYTALDPYYFTVDNRPLNDIDANIRTVAAAVDNSAGDARRSAMGAASAAYALSGPWGTVGTYAFPGSAFAFRMDYCFHTVMDLVDVGGQDVNMPFIAVHDNYYQYNNIVPATTAGQTNSYQVLVSYRSPNNSDRIPTDSSDILVANFDVRFLGAYPTGGTPLTQPAPPNQSIVFYIEVPNDALRLDESNIIIRDGLWRDVATTSNVLASLRFDYTDFQVTLTSGSQTINLSSSGLALDRPDAIEIFVEGVNQFDWTFNAATNIITLADPLTADARVRVRQTTIL